MQSEWTPKGSLHFGESKTIRRIAYMCVRFKKMMKSLIQEKNIYTQLSAKSRAASMTLLRHRCPIKLYIVEVYFDVFMVLWRRVAQSNVNYTTVQAFQ